MKWFGIASWSFHISSQLRGNYLSYFLWPLPTTHFDNHHRNYYIFPNLPVDIPNKAQSTGAVAHIQITLNPPCSFLDSTTHPQASRTRLGGRFIPKKKTSWKPKKVATGTVIPLFFWSFREFFNGTNVRLKVRRGNSCWYLVTFNSFNHSALTSSLAHSLIWKVTV
jgi:hypothetical protein